MPHRYQDSAAHRLIRLRPFSAIRSTFRGGYGKSDLVSDVLAGSVVGLVALPLAMALAIATGVSPQHGLYTVMTAGFIVALFGGSQFNVSGPTAAFVVILAPIVHEHGLGGLLLAGLMAGIILILMGIFRLGRLIQFIPYTVTTGFTSGIAVVIASIQIKDFLGLSFSKTPESFSERLVEIGHSLSTISLPEITLGLLTLFILIVWPKVTKKIPAPLVALTFAAFAGALIHSIYPTFEFASLGSRFSTLIDGEWVKGIPEKLPNFQLPWTFYGGDGSQPLGISLEILRDLLPSAFAIAMLGAIESLLSAVIADGLTKTKHDPDAELVALGTGNIFAPFFGGIAATGAIARTATNIRFGARSPVAAMTHAIFVLLSVLLFAPWLSYLPMASLAALLLMVAWNISERHQFMHILRVAPRSDVLVLLTCFLLTVWMDMVVGVGVGIVLASLLFIRRMSELTQAQSRESEEHSRIQRKIPGGILIYEISGPLFFGAAQKAIEALQTSGSTAKVVVVDLQMVPTMDITGLVALESMIDHLKRSHRKAVLACAQPQPLSLIQKSLSLKASDDLQFASNLPEAVQWAEKALELCPIDRTTRQ